MSIIHLGKMCIIGSICPLIERYSIINKLFSNVYDNSMFRSDLIETINIHAEKNYI